MKQYCHFQTQKSWTTPLKKAMPHQRESKKDVTKPATGVPLERLSQDLDTLGVVTTGIAHYTKKIGTLISNIAIVTYDWRSMNIPTMFKTLV